MNYSVLLGAFTIILMFAGGHCASESMSCSTVNGKTMCEKQSSDGNIAAAGSNAFAGGPGNEWQNAFAGTGNSRTGASSSSQSGNWPPGFAPGGSPGGFPGGFAGGFPGGFVGGFPGGFVGGFAAAGGFPGGGGGAFAGGFPGGFDPFRFVFGGRR